MSRLGLALVKLAMLNPVPAAATVVKQTAGRAAQAVTGAATHAAAPAAATAAAKAPTAAAFYSMPQAAPAQAAHLNQARPIGVEGVPSAQREAAHQAAVGRHAVTEQMSAMPLGLQQGPGRMAQATPVSRNLVAPPTPGAISEGAHGVELSQARALDVPYTRLSPSDEAGLATLPRSGALPPAPPVPHRPDIQVRPGNVWYDPKAGLSSPGVKLAMLRLKKIAALLPSFMDELRRAA